MTEANDGPRNADTGNGSKDTEPAAGSAKPAAAAKAPSKALAGKQPLPKSPSDTGNSTMSMDRICFANLAERENSARRSLQAEEARLTRRQSSRGDLTDGEAYELARVQALLKRAGKVFDGKAYVDPLFAGVAHAFGDDDSNSIAVNLDGQGFLSVDGDNGRLRTRAALTLGYIELDQTPLPRLAVGTGTAARIEPDPRDPASRRLRQDFYVALGEVKANFDLAMRVLPLLAKEGNVPGRSVTGGPGDGIGTVSTLEFARVMRALVARNVTAGETQLPRQLSKALDNVQDVGDDRPLHDLNIKLPDLEDTIEAGEVIGQHIVNAGTAIFSSMFDELKAFKVVDTLVDMSVRGTLTIGRGLAGTRLYQYWRDAPTRMSEGERQTFYAMTLGIPGGPPDVNANTDFNDLWMRFVSAVTLLTREDRIDRLVRASSAVSGGQQPVRKAARDLAYNLSAHGYGMSFYIAQDLNKQINEMIELLNYPEIKASCGATNLWGVIDQIAATEHGGARNSSKYRTLATCGAIITAWLARNIDRLSPQAGVPMIDLLEVQSPPARRAGETATTHPSDYDLVNACELWIADTAVSDDRIEEMGQPRESPQGPSRPIQVPSIARDLLETSGLGLGMSAPNGGGRRAGNGYGSY